MAYLKTGANGAITPTTTPITVGNGTNYSNSVQGLISAINNSGLGLTATFGTAASGRQWSCCQRLTPLLQGGGSGADTGIIISGAGVGIGGNVGVVGALTVSGLPQDPLAGTLNVTGADGASHTITLGLADSTDNITNLAATINAAGLWNYGLDQPRYG